MDRIRHCCGADPDTTFYFDADSHPDPDPTPSFKQIGMSEIFLAFIHNNSSLHRFIFLVSVIIGFVILGVTVFGQNILKFFSFSLHLIEMDPNPAK